MFDLPRDLHENRMCFHEDLVNYSITRLISLLQRQTSPPVAAAIEQATSNDPLIVSLIRTAI